MSKNISITNGSPCTISNSTDNIRAVQADGPFIWDHGEQTLLLGSYFYGYTANQMLGGYLTYVFGFYRVMAFSIGLTALLNLMM